MTKTRRSMDAIIEHTLPKWPRFQLVTATKEEM